MECRPGEGGEGLWAEVPAHTQQGSFVLWCVCTLQISVSSAVIQGSHAELSCRLSPQPGRLQPPQHGSSPWHSPFLALQARLGLALLLSSPLRPVYLCYIYMSIL